jgi:hypothetical protein
VLTVVQRGAGSRRVGVGDMLRLIQYTTLTFQVADP